jgi:hypothetical protein
MTSPRPRFAILAATVCAAVLAGACSDTLGLPAAAEENVVDTVSLWALHGTGLSLPSAYQLVPKGTVRTDRSSSFDFAFDVDTLGRPVFLPTGALGLGVASGLRHTTVAFDSIKTAPTGTYVADSAFVVDSGMVAVVRSRPTQCGFGTTVFYYAKLQVLAVDTIERRIDLKILVDQNCGYRSLQPGLPRS